MEVFDTPFWNKYPFALPGFVACTFTIVATTLGFFWIEEVSILKSAVGTNFNEFQRPFPRDEEFRIHDLTNMMLSLQ